MDRPPPDIDPATEQEPRDNPWSLALAVTALAIACFSLGMAIGSARAEPVSSQPYVIDGDTIVLPPQAGRSPVGQQNTGEKVRILNIDAPETSRARCEAEAALGYKAKERLAQLLRGAVITLQRCDGNRCTDPYGRTLARVFANGQDVGEVLISEGLATRWPRRFDGCGFSR